ncbi:MAG: hypothetical protein OXU68_07465 [Bacteroidota bacterium]|nr:hypothetical protein [Bacteroidota bacterium]MDE2956824.1 hypothetical protein [Bacteroidota bacterium]
MHPLLGREILTDHLIAPRTRVSMSGQDWTMPDSSIVVLLGGVGCSGDQVAALRQWTEIPQDSRWRDYLVIAIYAAPLVGEENGIHEALILRRLSRARFSFFVS